MGCPSDGATTKWSSAHAGADDSALCAGSTSHQRPSRWTGTRSGNNTSRMHKHPRGLSVSSGSLIECASSFRASPLPRRIDLHNDRVTLCICSSTTPLTGLGESHVATGAAVASRRAHGAAAIAGNLAAIARCAARAARVEGGVISHGLTSCRLTRSEHQSFMRGPVVRLPNTLAGSRADAGEHGHGKRADQAGEVVDRRPWRRGLRSAQPSLIRRAPRRH